MSKLNKNIIIAILVVIIIAIGAYVMFSQQAPAEKMNTEFYLLSDNSVNNGAQIIFQLKEKNGSTIAGEKVKIGFTDGNGNVETFEVVTDSAGKGALTIENEAEGSHNLTLVYDGNDKYNGCGLTVSINVGGDSSDASSDAGTVSNDNSASSNNPSNTNTTPENQQHWNYDEETGVYYLDDGTIVGDTQAGGNIWEYKKLWEETGGDPYRDIS